MNFTSGVLALCKMLSLFFFFFFSSGMVLCTVVLISFIVCWRKYNCCHLEGKAKLNTYFGQRQQLVITVCEKCDLVRSVGLELCSFCLPRRGFGIVYAVVKLKNCVCVCVCVCVLVCVCVCEGERERMLVHMTIQSCCFSYSLFFLYHPVALRYMGTFFFRVCALLVSFHSNWWDKVFYVLRLL